MKMMGVKCKSCDKVFYPKRIRCPNCKGKSIEESELGDECRLITYTELYAVPRGVEKIPLVLGIVEFRNGARALGQITSKDVKLGMRLRPVWGFLRKVKGKEVYGFKFEPENMNKKTRKLAGKNEKRRDN